MKYKKTMFLMMTLSLWMGGCAESSESEPQYVETEVAEELPPARLQDDFYRYINEETLKNAEFDYKATVSEASFDNKEVKEQLKEIIQEVAAGDNYEAGSEEDIIKKVQDLYLAYDFENTPVPEELDALFHEIDEISTMDEFFRMDARLMRDYNVDSILNLWVGPDYRGDGENILCFDQYIAILDCDFAEAEESRSPFLSLKNTGSAVSKAMGHDTESADQNGKDFGGLAMEIYFGTDLEEMQSENPEEYFAVYTRDQVEQILNVVDLDIYLEAFDLDVSCAEKFGVSDAGQLEVINEILTEENLEGLKTWKMTALAYTYQKFVVYGYKELEEYAITDYDSEEDRVLKEIMRSYPKEIDPLYVEKYYTEEMDADLNRMCEDIREGYRELISNADWLSDDTRDALLRKLENMVFITGADVKRHDNTEYAELKGEDYFSFYVEYNRLAMRKKMATLMEAPDRKQQGFSMHAVNACYMSYVNSFQIDAAIMKAPFYDPDADYYTNLGGLGAIMAHEIGHAFDSKGIMFNENGIYDPTWIAAEDIQKLEDRNEEAVKYFEENFTVFGVYHVDGKQTLGENYADLGGMECIVTLADTKEERMRIFENYAKIWCAKLTDTEMLGRLRYDSHAPYVLRVNAILSSLDAFYETYDVKEGDDMYIAPEQRISRWY